MEGEIYGLSELKLRHQGRGRVLDWFASCLPSVVGRNCDCSLSDGLRGIVVFASPCRETAVSIWPRQGVTLLCLFLPAEREEGRELNGLYDLSRRRKVSCILLLLKTLLENCTISSSCQQGREGAVISFCWGRNRTGCPLALNPGTHPFISVDWFYEALSNGCPDSRIQGNK